MANPGKLITRSFRLGFRFSSLCTYSSTNFVPGSKALYSNWNPEHRKLHICHQTLAKNFKSKSQRTMGALSPLDPSSFSRPEWAIVKHISVSLNVDFERKVLTGNALLHVDHLVDGKDIILDVNNLTIQSIELEDGTPLNFTVDNHVANFGSKLTVSLPASPEAKKTKLRIKYQTSPDASALQWLEPKQTSGQKHPYLFSQCQPIHARSILPCQDSPAVKFTYDAEVTAPAQYTVLMSALRGDQLADKTTFRQPVPLPSYLFAIAVGVLESRKIGPRTSVWAEPAEIEQSANEFSETEQYLQTAERLCGKYEWTQYDLLVLPPSFPYGGMENPCLTFVTPTLLAGDKSLANVIVHEIMHSWTGNLVTNRNFEHFWLNEGWTVYLERRVGAMLFPEAEEGKKDRDFQSLLGLQELRETVKTFLGETSALTRLVPDLNGVHPDDAFSRVPYEKGSLFLRYLEDLVGGPAKFDTFIHAYLAKFRRGTVDTAQFKELLLQHFASDPAADKLRAVDWQTWLHAPGMPPVTPQYDMSNMVAVTAVVNKIHNENVTLDKSDVAQFSPHQMICLLQELIDKPALPLARLEELGSVYNVSRSNNAELKYRWTRLCIRSRAIAKIDNILNFLNSQGRMKYVRPIYRDLYDWAEVRGVAISNFLKQEPYMMHVSAYTIRKDLHLDAVNE